MNKPYRDSPPTRATTRAATTKRALAVVVAILVPGVVGCASEQKGEPSHKGSAEPTAGQKAEPVQASFSLIATTDGLEPQHAKETPLLEKLAYLPAAEHGNPSSCNAQRIYRDGAFYFTTPRPSKCGGKWNRLTTNTPEGLRQLEEHFASFCRELAKSPGDHDGSLVYRVTSLRCTREFVIRGIPDGEQARFVQRADEIINRTGTPIPPNPRPAAPDGGTPPTTNRQ